MASTRPFPRILRRLMKGKFDAYTYIVTFGQKVPKLNNKPVYYSRLYGNYLQLTYKLISPITDLANFPAKGKIVCKILSLAWFVQSILRFGPWASISARKNDFLIKETLDEIVADTIKAIKQGIADIGNWNWKKIVHWNFIILFFCYTI